MGAAEDSPQAAFARFVRQAIDHARNERGWTVTDLATHTGIGRSTVFRWLAGDWQDYPELAKVRGFCAALEVPVAAAFRALGLPAAGGNAGVRADGEPGARRTAVAGDDPRLDEDLRVILARLTDPAVPDAEKKLIRDLLRYLASRPLRQAG